MSAKGLNKAQREIVRGMITSEAGGEEIQERIKRMSDQTFYGSGEWGYDENVQLCGELAANGYPKTAQTLERLINDR